MIMFKNMGQIIDIMIKNIIQTFIGFDTLMKCSSATISPKRQQYFVYFPNGPKKISDMIRYSV